MKANNRWLGCHALLLLLGTVLLPTSTILLSAEPLPWTDFRLTDTRGKVSHLAEIKTPLVVMVFLGTECPLAQLYAPRLEQLSQKYAGRGVTFLGINSNRQDSLADMVAYVKRTGITFTLGKDLRNQVADAMKAHRTPEVFVLDEQRRVRYRGRIDDQYGVGYSRTTAKRHDLAMAIDQLLAGEKVTVDRTTPVGCHIGRLRPITGNHEVTYHEHVQPLLKKHCVQCHQPGEIGPFSLTDYQEVAGWAETIQEVVQLQRMPPWHASPRHGEFRNARFVSDQEKSLLRRWVAAGAPEGKPVSGNDAGKPLPVVQTKPWKPDVTIAMRERPYEVPAEGVVQYQYFVVDPGFKEDKWISDAKIVAGNRSVVHHAIVFVRPPGNTRTRGFGWLTGYVPGQSNTELPPGLARRIPAGSKLIFQMHYTPVGKVVEDRTRIEMKFVEAETVQHEVLTMLAMNRDFEIPPGMANFREEAVVDAFPQGARLLAIAPHMHVRGKSFRFVHQRGSENRILLDVPQYDFNWQHVYELRDYVELKPGDRLQCVAHFDNSSQNPVNPDPTATVRWGDQTWEEMLIGYCMVAVPVGSPVVTDADKALRQLAEKKARKFLEKFDRNKDGQLEKNEVPVALARFGFRRLDRNDDGVIVFREAVSDAMRTLRGKN
ncbi:MAG: redoxin domain-containing protein [Planctomycetota bacterium]|nr:redoxin domain-containing protein [Planctomycetota bacterium]